MSDPQFDSLQLVGLHEPDSSVETDSNGQKYSVELPGSYHIGFIKDGVFRAIHTIKAAGLFADIQRQQDAQGSQPSQPSADPSASQPSSGQPSGDQPSASG